MGTITMKIFRLSGGFGRVLPLFGVAAISVPLLLYADPWSIDGDYRDIAAVTAQAA